MSLTNKSPAETYKDLLYVNNSNNGITTTIKNVHSGGGTQSAVAVSDRALQVKSATNNTTAFDVQNSGGDSKLLVDTSNNYVKANGVFVNTQYAYFGVAHSISANFVTNTHYPLTFQGNNQSPSDEHNFSLGTGTDPATTFTADGSTSDAALVVPCLMYVPDNISIDSVTAIEGADAATGDTTRMHLMSYTFTSGSTSCLSSGTLLAHNSDVTNAGSEQAYLTTWTVDSASVTAGKVILATFRSDSVNSDYSVSVTVKYHSTG